MYVRSSHLMLAFDPNLNTSSALKAVHRLLLAHGMAFLEYVWLHACACIAYVCTVQCSTVQ